ncbi:MAG: hypothetical protein JWP75_416, partial [Frondihabitans sp.]|nr:hypothetical protein [Frondihabitans sp.]
MLRNLLLFLALALAASAHAPPAQAFFPRGVATTPGCAFGSSLGDGCPAANQNANFKTTWSAFLASAAQSGQSYVTTHVSGSSTPLNIGWNLPGIDYPVGYDTTVTLHDPTVKATFTGVLAAGVLTASAVTGTIVPGEFVESANNTGGVTGNTVITSQLTGTAGGAGTYQTSLTQNLASTSMVSSWLPAGCTFASPIVTCTMSYAGALDTTVQNLDFSANNCTRLNIQGRVGRIVVKNNKWKFGSSCDISNATIIAVLNETGCNNQFVMTNNDYDGNIN